ncbi:MAG: twin-arginine translocase TatA/TatE family subunit [Chloroflexi bacterium OHK40]
MEIFNIHIFEFLLIAGLALVIFGPERLPEVGRFIGQQVARFLAWQQQSPELRMINDVRSEFEREIASLRDELVRTRRDLDISADVNAIREDLRPMLDLKAGLKDTRPAGQRPNGADSSPAGSPADLAGAEGASASAGASAEATPVVAPSQPDPLPGPDGAGSWLAPEASATPGEPPALAATPEPDALTPQPAAQTVPASARPNRLAATEPTDVLSPAPAQDARAAYLAERRQRLHDAPPPDDIPAPAEPPTTGGPADLAEDERARLLRQLQSLTADLQALVGELQARGILGPDWQPPSQPREQETMSR